MTTSLPPAGIPASGNQKYIGIAALLLLFGSCLAYWKFRGGDQVQTTTVVQTLPSSLAPSVNSHRDDDDIPPPPDPVAVSTGTAGQKVAGPAGTLSNGCEVRACKGTAGDDLVASLAQRGRQARRCYEKELNNDPKLSVRMTMQVRVGTNGGACSANVVDSDNPGVAACVAGSYRTGGFPPARGGCAEVNIPLKFVPGK
jgi:hypothetical protein